MTVKIMDFGLSRLTQSTRRASATLENDSSLGPDGLMTTPVGTPSFIAPEILKGLPYGREIDMFACGVVMYWLLCGYLPFQHEDPYEMMEQIKRTDYKFPEPERKTISESAKDLISGLLDGSPYTRTTADDALAHAWIAEIHKSDVNQKTTLKAEKTDGDLSSIGEPSQNEYLQDVLNWCNSAKTAHVPNRIHNLTAVHSLSF